MSYLRKLKNLFMYIFVGFITVALGVIVITNFNNSRKTQEQGDVLLLDLYSSMIENQFDKIAQVANFIYSDDDTFFFMNEAEDNNYPNLLMQKKMSFYSNNVDSLNCKFGVMKDKGDVITADSVLPYSVFQQQINAPLIMLDECLEQMQNDPYASPVCLLSEDESKLIVISCNNFSFSNSMVLFAVIDLSAFDMNQLKDRTFTVLLGEKVIISKGEFASVDTKKAIEETKTFTFLKDSVENTFFEQEITYGLIQKKPTFFQSYSLHIVIFIFFFLIAFAISRMISDALSKKVYKPIMDIKQHFENYNLNGDIDEIKFICDSIDDMEMNRQKMIEELQIHKNIVNNKLCRDLLTGMITYSENLFCFGCTDIAYAFVTIVRFNDCDNFETNTFISYKDNVKKKIIELIDEGKFIFAIDIDKKSFAVVLKNVQPSTFENKLNKEFREKTNFVTVIGKVVEEVNLLYESFQIAQDVIESIKINSAVGQVINASDMQLSVKTGCNLSFDRIISKYVVEGNSESLKGIIDEMVLNYFGCEYILKETLTIFSNHILDIVNKILLSENLKWNDFFTRDVYHELKRCDSILKIKVYCDELFGELARYYADKNNSKAESFKNNIDEFIEKNYIKDISLLDISSYLGLSIGYTCALIKQYYNQTFKEVLSDYRFSIAKKEVKANPKIKVSELSLRIGLNNTSSFKRILKNKGFLNYQDFINDTLK